MVEQLFGSKTRVKLLQLFYSNPNRSFYVREITRKIGEQINSVRRELSNLLSIGIITSDNTNNKLYYEVNQKYDYYSPLQEIFGKGVKNANKHKLNKEEKEAEEPDELKAMGHIDLALYTGQFTRDNGAGIDLFIVGEVNNNAVQKYVETIEEKENKSIRYTVMSLDDFTYRQQINDKFAIAISNAKKQIIVDKQHLLSKEKQVVEEEVAE